MILKGRWGIGVTGSRKGLSEAQRAWVETRLATLSYTVLHHGDCVGADAEVHQMFEGKGHIIVVHPPLDPRWRAWCKGTTILPEGGYLERDANIVQVSEEVWAFPSKPEGQAPRSGTWATVRMARRAGIPLSVVMPDGEVLK